MGSVRNALIETCFETHYQCKKPLKTICSHIEGYRAPMNIHVGFWFVRMKICRRDRSLDQVL